VYNLCSERNYDPALFDGRVEYYPFDDHNAPPLQMIYDCCESVQQWLDAASGNVAVIHCKVGLDRGRSCESVGVSRIIVFVRPARVAPAS
jgi:phosphatidylinositol-3,4,5-trisphosphate 3-phosphatase and dual-specificity protein phosphatase PTEN